MSQPDPKDLTAEAEQLNAELAGRPWFRGSYWGPAGHSGAAAVPGWVVQVAPGHPEAEAAVTAANSKLNLSGPALRVVVQPGDAHAYAS